jgi:hypothetical protein
MIGLVLPMVEVIDLSVSASAFVWLGRMRLAEESREAT